jgi:hypothetical protein
MGPGLLSKYHPNILLVCRAFGLQRGIASSEVSLPDRWCDPYLTEAICVSSSVNLLHGDL